MLATIVYNHLNTGIRRLFLRLLLLLERLTVKNPWFWVWLSPASGLSCEPGHR